VWPRDGPSDRGTGHDAASEHECVTHTDDRGGDRRRNDHRAGRNHRAPDDSPCRPGDGDCGRRRVARAWIVRERIVDTYATGRGDRAAGLLEHRGSTTRYQLA
jgi:hypothetical protein